MNLRIRFLNWRRGFDENDLGRLRNKLYDPAAFSGGILPMTRRELNALPEINEFVMESAQGRAMLYEFLANIEGKGLRFLRRAY